MAARYLHGSGRAWVLACVVPGDRTWLSFVFVAGESKRPGDLPARLGVAASALKQCQEALGACDADWSCDLEEQDALRFLAQVLGHLEAARRLAEASARRRGGGDVLSYLRVQGLFDGTPWALNRIVLHADGGLKPVRGYYLGAGSHFLFSEITGTTHCYLQQAGSIFARRAAVVEHVFTPATHANTPGYHPDAEQGIVPSFGPELRGVDEREYALRLERIAPSAAEDYVADSRTRSILKESRGGILRNAQRLLSSPIAQEAGAFRRLRCRPRSTTRWILATAAVSTMVTRTGHGPGRRDAAQVPGTRKPDSPWPEGEAARSSPVIRRLLRALLGVADALRRMRGLAPAGRT